MLSAKDNFINRMDSFDKALASSDLISRALTDNEHNEKARMLRNGMAIIGYTILEDFIKNRVGEILKKVGSSNVPFSSLPQKLQETATTGALKGIQVRAQNLRNDLENHLEFIQNETLCVSSTKNSVYEISAYSLGWDKSNISEKDVSDYLNIFNVDGGWDAIREISSSINISLVSPNQIFRNAAQRRHKAAHDATADSLFNDLKNYVSQSKVIALGIDALLSKSLKHIMNNNTTFLIGRDKTKSNQLVFRFLNEDGGKWKEYSRNISRAVRVKAIYGEIFPECLTRSRTNNEILIVKSSSNQIINWYNTEC